MAQTPGAAETAFVAQKVSETSGQAGLSLQVSNHALLDFRVNAETRGRPRALSTRLLAVSEGASTLSGSQAAPVSESDHVAHVTLRHCGNAAGWGLEGLSAFRALCGFIEGRRGPGLEVAEGPRFRRPWGR
eukprot:8607142-Alexandrium_andersonii.AAC.1